ncbi:hypothetical protein [Phycisphaera mikurensis]|uniref:Uncharacterized protein n=1 Tax=Phycisphaera mikurensis (strain NBRC 102666 / KCTC 22515 / FYK2301M01) TaxID=1142394 RepID=I0IID5_PHYMF|nr:hypothetical protein [Phycisphaera mikurensis]MBB6442413.1 hypothetical protein [Phycisphaera mikurensis]BAM05023.1 hypothetical protein PSMK_28640 [Phycisphaera mikurensis NBRC 102666]
MPQSSATSATSEPSPADPPAAAPAGPLRLREVGGGIVRFSVPGTDYRLEAAAGGSLGPSAAAGQRLRGTLHAVARKVWPVAAGGRFVEPVFGRPRRIQAAVLGADEASNTLHLDAGGVKFAARLGHAGQRVADFPPQTLVTLSVDDHVVLEAAPAD